MENAHVSCYWDPGNPPQRARLLINNRDVTPSDSKEGFLNHTLGNVTCKDSADITCHVPSSRQNRSVTLLVKCPPEFKNGTLNKTVDSGNDTLLEFPFWSHTRNHTHCTMEKLATTADDPVSRNCCSLVNITGMPPNLILTIYVANITKADEGVWRLNLTNDMGSGYVNVLLVVRNVTETPNACDESRNNSWLLVVLAVVMVAVALAVSISVVCYCKRNHEGGKEKEEHCEMQPNPVYGMCGDVVRNNANSPYSEVKDVMTCSPGTTPQAKGCQEEEEHCEMLPNPVYGMCRNFGRTKANSPYQEVKDVMKCSPEGCQKEEEHCEMLPNSVYGMCRDFVRTNTNSSYQEVKDVMKCSPGSSPPASESE